jgi:hypothetical protein
MPFLFALFFPQVYGPAAPVLGCTVNRLPFLSYGFLLPSSMPNSFYGITSSVPQFTRPVSKVPGGHQACAWYDEKGKGVGCGAAPQLELLWYLSVRKKKRKKKKRKIRFS